MSIDAVSAARELGRAIQQDARFTAYTEARLRNDNDGALQNLIGEFNLTRQNLQLEMNKPADVKDSDKINTLNRKMQAEYAAVMGNVNMAEFTVAKRDMDKMINEIQQIISLCCDGEDPDTCEAVDCGGSCETCGGCG